ncbi:ribonucleoside diphosphate reductase small subunit [Vibrio phage 11895-B1]|uniref:ribonucleoside diphosphate reductase small subunit n=1 Tax=Vibrio phage 11895-B1 TaxID=754075 RepID=UPI0002C0C10A|nr:ribonucleoside diphosphate reductase small subunit [Vibrio phage 11895-B1]AGH32083.1 ribonucleoside-diphosphate reductase subunit beta [Vibrio phage 11895-B1]
MINEEGAIPSNAGELMILEKAKLFNVDGDDRKESQQIFGGNPTGILNLNNVKYKWVTGFWNTMLNNHWIPNKISLVNDKTTIKELTTEEDEAVRDTLGFLIFLDSLQVNNLPNIADYVTCSGTKTLLTVQTFQEAVHSQSYQYILESLYSESDRNKIYDTWRTNPTLLERNKFIASQMQDFVDVPTENNFKKVQVANLALEGIYFYEGFNLFDQLASRQKLVGTQKMIDYIRTDENSHVALFTKIIHETMDTSKEDTMINDILGKACEQEINWAQETYGDSILGVSKDSSEEFVKHLTNQRLKALRLPNMWDNVKNPYTHLDIKSRGNFFETSGMTDYSQSGAVGGWDDF